MKLKALIFTVLFAASCLSLSAQEEWINIEKKGYENPSGNQICTDKNGNTFIVGKVKQATFDTSANLVTQEVFIAKFSPTGQNLWVRAISNINTSASVVGLVATEEGDVLMAGTYSEAGETILGVPLPPSDGYIFAAKVSANGAVSWVKKIDFPIFQYQETYARSITADGKGNLFVAFTHSQSNSTEATAFIAKLKNSDGSRLWLKSFQGANISWETTRVSGIAADSVGNIYATGHYTSQFITSDTSIRQSVGRTAFIAKFDSLGNKKWIRFNKSPLSIEANTRNTGYNVIVSKDGKYLYATGHYAPDSTVVPEYAFDGKAPLSKKGRYTDIRTPYDYIAFMDPLTGSYKWVKMSPYGDYFFNKLALDSLNNCYMRSFGGEFLIYDSIPMPPSYGGGGIVKINDKGTIFPASQLADIGLNIGSFALYKNRLLVVGSINAGTTQMYYESGVTPVTVNRINRVFVASIKMQNNNNFSIILDSVKTSGECFKQPIAYKLKTSTFRANNKFVVQLTDPNTKEFDNFYVDEFAASATKLDTFSRLFSPSYDRYIGLDSAAKLRICSTNPMVCSPPFFLSNPVINLLDKNICTGDTIRLGGVKNAAGFAWSPSNKIVGSATLATPLAKPDSTTTYSVAIKSKLGCTQTFTQEIKVLFANLNLQDTVVIPCNSPDDAVRLIASFGSTNSYGTLPNNCQWLPTRFLSDSTSFVPVANPLRTTKYYITFRDTTNKCVYKDSVLVKVDTCKFIYGKTTPNNFVQAVVVNNRIPEIIKTKQADVAGNYVLRLPQTNIYALTSPSKGFYVNDNAPLTYTYFDSSLTIQKARLIRHTTTDSIAVNFFSFKNNATYTNNEFKGFIYDFNDPTLPIKNLDLILVDTNITRILRGRLTSDSLFSNYAKTNADGSFSFPSVRLNKPYYLWANRVGINNDVAPPRVIIFKKDENERVFYVKDSLLINCSEAGSPCGTVRGRVSLNSFRDCSFDFSSQPRQQHVIKLLPLNLYTATDSAGNYQFRVPPATYSLTTTIPNYYIPLCGTSATFTNVQVLRDSSAKRDFKFYSDAQILDYSSSLTASTRFRPGFENTIAFTVKSLGTLSESVNLSLKYPRSKMVFLGNDGNNYYADTSTVSEIRFGNIYNVNTSNDNLTINLRFRVFPTTRLGDSIIMSSNVMVNRFGTQDSFPRNNVDTLRDIVVGSYDPNDKDVSPKGNIPPETDKFNFTIRFQNTGTDTAFTVVLRDTLSDVWNPLTLKTIAASHPYRFVLKGNGIIEWHFQNILLPDSFRNEKASHGFVKFSIQPKEIPLSIGVKLQNKAGIYFDYNAPIITNTTTNTVIKLPTKTLELSDNLFIIYPNPAKDALFIELPNAPSNILNVNIYNALGQLVAKENLKERVNKLGVNDLPTGLYVIKITDGQNTQSRSFIIAQ
jgi:Secretion system C-terminal sorting domain